MMLLGIYKNIEELEESISLDELEAILTAHQEQQYTNRKFAAALKGINLDDEVKDEQEDRFEIIRARAEARLAGKSEQELEKSEYEFFGIDLETE